MLRRTYLSILATGGIGTATGIKIGSVRAVSPTRTAQTEEVTPIQQSRLAAKDGDENDLFGTGLAVDGDTLLVGAPQDEDPNGNNAGSAYIFEQSDGEWTQEAKVTPNDGDEDDNFGESVALDGNTAIVSAWHDEDPNGKNAGSAYVFERSDGEWTQEAKFAPNEQGGEGDEFGVSVTLEGDTAFVGAWRDDDDQGAAYIFERSDSGWTQVTRLKPDDITPGDRFGTPVLLDGDTALIAAPGYNRENEEGIGAVYSFEQSGGDWEQEARLTADDGDGGDNFGTLVALDGDTALIGAWHDEDPNGENAGSAYVFEQSGSNWTQEAKLTAEDGDENDEFGWDVALDGDTAIIGAKRDEDPNGFDAGSAYVFERSNGGWSQETKLTPDDGGGEDDAFAYKIALSGETAIVNARQDENPNGEGAGAVYVFDLTGEEKTPTPTATPTSTPTVTPTSTPTATPTSTTTQTPAAPETAAPTATATPPPTVTDTATETPGSNGPGFGILAAITGLFGWLLWSDVSE